MPRRYRPFGKMPAYDRQRLLRRMPSLLRFVAFATFGNLFGSAVVALPIVRLVFPSLQPESWPWIAAFSATWVALVSAATFLADGSLNRRLLAKRTRRRGRTIALRALLAPTDALPTFRRRIKHALWRVAAADRALVPTLWLTDADGRAVEARYPVRPASTRRPRKAGAVLIAWDESRVARFVAVAPMVARSVALTVALILATLAASAWWVRQTTGSLDAWWHVWPVAAKATGVVVSLAAAWIALAGTAHFFRGARIDVREDGVRVGGRFYPGRHLSSAPVDPARRTMTLRAGPNAVVVVAIAPDVNLAALEAVLAMALGCDNVRRAARDD